MKNLLHIIVLTVLVFCTNCSKGPTIASSKPNQSSSNQQNAHVGPKNNMTLNPDGTYSSPKTLSEEETAKRLIEAKRLFAPWLNSAKLVANKSKDADAKIYIDILENSLYVTAIDPEDPNMLAIEPLNDVPDKTRPFLKILSVSENFQPPNKRWEEWMKPLQGKMSATYQSEIDLLAVAQNQVTNPVLAGLILQHEMQHGMQDATMTPEGRVQTQKLPQLLEVDAYQFEFRLIDEFNNPMTKILCDEYMGKFVNSDGKPIPLNGADPRLDSIFGPFADPKERNLAAGLLYMKAFFQLADTFGEPGAQQRKIQLMIAQGYH